MERSLAGMLFLVAGVSLAISGGGWWLQRIVFTPDDNRATAAAMLTEPEIRQEINNVVANAAAGAVDEPVSQLGPFLETDVLSTRAGAAMMAPLMRQIHDRVIGNRDDRDVWLTGTDMVQIVRDERAGELKPVLLPIPVIGTLKTMRTTVGWLIPISAAIAVIALLLALVTRPERRDVLRGLGEFGIALAASMLVFGYLLPVHMFTAIDNSTWTQVAPRLALRTLPVVLGSAAIFGLGGVGLILASTSGGKRRQWSTPLSVTRYRGGDNPGWG